jgi:hypothetical protein
MDLARGRAVVRPWLQAFKWRVSRYDSAYITAQTRASDDSGARGYLFWNARNSYGEVMEALARERAEGKPAGGSPSVEEPLHGGKH